MFADFLKRLVAPEPAPLNDGDARLALTALLVRIARSDNDYSPAEVAQIDRVIAQRYGLSAAEAAALRWCRRCGRSCWPMVNAPTAKTR